MKLPTNLLPALKQAAAVVVTVQSGELSFADMRLAIGLCRFTGARRIIALDHNRDDFPVFARSALGEISGRPVIFTHGAGYLGLDRSTAIGELMTAQNNQSIFFTGDTSDRDWRKRFGQNQILVPNPRNRTAPVRIALDLFDELFQGDCLCTNDVPLNSALEAIGSPVTGSPPLINELFRLYQRPHVDPAYAAILGEALIAPEPKVPLPKQVAAYFEAVDAVNGSLVRGKNYVVVTDNKGVLKPAVCADVAREEEIPFYVHVRKGSLMAKAHDGLSWSKGTDYLRRTQEAIGSEQCDQPHWFGFANPADSLAALIRRLQKFKN